MSAPLPYSAMLLEGERAGMLRSCTSEHLYVEEASPLPAYGPPEEPFPGLRFKTRVYRHTRLTSTERAFWVPVEERDPPAWIIAQLLKGFDGRKVQP